MKLFGSSGIRAVFDTDLLHIAFRTGVAVGRHYHDVAVGTDTRTSGDAMKHAVISGLLAGGAVCHDAGVVPTPTLAYVTRHFGAGVMITASHNPPEYNGVKLFNPDGSSFDTTQQQEIESEILAESCDSVSWDRIQSSGVYSGAIGEHIEAVLKSISGEFKLNVVVDAGGGAASEVTPVLMERLGCEVVPLYCRNTGFFPRVVEPTEPNLKDLCRAVRESGADIGIAHDGDADRMMAVDNKGRFISGDKMLSILAKAMQAKNIVTTLDASMAVEETGLDIRRTRIGDTWVSEELRKGGDFGGETSGAWIFPEISLCPDGIFAAALVVSIASRQPLSDLVDAAPVYPLKRGNVAADGISMKRLEEKLAVLFPKSVSKIDGIRLEFADGWLLVRPSGTEPKIRLTAEAKTGDRAEQIFEDALKIIKDLSTGGRKN
jgi:phosphoglucosamine mutase